ncbi:MAG: HAD-IA family hydrolase [Pseudomonadota bacterium]|nr:HAD-IA family hydrolase [Pseudomonadota bacterium]
MRAVIFDLDGTLIDSLPDVMKALNAVLEHNDRRPLSTSETRSMIGGGADVLLQNAFKATGSPLPHDNVISCVEAFTSHYLSDHTSENRLFDGVRSALKILSAQDTKLGVCTNKPQKMALSILKSLELDAHIPVCIGKGQLPYHKPDRRHYDEVVAALGVAVHQSLYVGDSETDVETARNAGVPLILVSHGYSKNPASMLGADRLIGHFSELPKVVDQLFAAMKCAAPKTGLV